jgi:hypothetical protein
MKPDPRTQDTRITGLTRSLLPGRVLRMNYGEIRTTGGGELVPLDQL